MFTCIGAKQESVLERYERLDKDKRGNSRADDAEWYEWLDEMAASSKEVIREYVKPYNLSPILTAVVMEYDYETKDFDYMRQVIQERTGEHAGLHNR